MKMPLRSLLTLAAAVALVGVGSTAGSAALATPEPANSQDAPAATSTSSGDVGALAVPVYQPAFEAKYVPITPCRIVDTRKGTGANGTPFQAGTTRAYYVGGTFGFAPQGGKTGGCGIPVGAVAVSATILAYNPKTKGYIRAWPNGEAEPTANVLYYSAAMAAGSTLSITTSSAIALRVRNYNATTDVVIDVAGYYVKPLAGFISPSGSPYAGSSRIINASHIGTGVYEVQFDRNIRYCSATASAYVSGYYASTTTWYDSGRPDTVRVSVYDAAGNPVDQYFYIQVDC